MRFHRESSDDHYDAIVVGAGVGGLVSAALLAHAGRRVLVIERHDRPGGYAHAFRRGPYVFDSAVHLVGGCHPTSAGPGGMIRRLLETLGVADRCEFIPIDPLYAASFPGLDIGIPSDVDEFVAAHAQAFPDEAKGIRTLVQECFAIRDELSRAADLADPLAMMRVPHRFPTLMKYRGTTVDDALRAHLRDPRAGALFTTLWPYVGLPPSRASFISWAVMLVSFLSDGGYYCKGSFQSFANALVTSIERNGGELLYRSPVRRIRVEDGRAVGVTLENGQRIAAPVVVSNMDLRQTVEELVGIESFPRRYVERLRRMRPSASALIVYAATDLDLASHGAAHETFVYSGWDHDHAFESTLSGRPDWLGVTLPTLEDPDLAPSGEHLVLLTSLVAADAVGHWRTECERTTRAMIDVAEERFPGLSRHLTFVEGATPRTLERYTRNTDGAAYGWENSPAQVGMARSGQETPVAGLVLAGQWTLPGGGVYGVAVSGVQAARRILGDELDRRFWESLAGRV